MHVWHLSLPAEDAVATRVAACLTPEEQATAQRFVFAPLRRAFALRRALLRHVLADYLGRPPASLRFLTGAHGKPSLADLPPGEDLRFNFSHSGEFALLAVTRGREVGVDIEQHRPKLDALGLAASCFAPAEVAALRKLAPAEVPAAFFAGWTRKEAFIKALGLGLSFPLDAFAVSLDEPAQLLQVRGVPPTPDEWTLRTLPVGPGYSAALALPGPAPVLRLWARA